MSWVSNVVWKKRKDGIDVMLSITVSKTYIWLSCKSSNLDLGTRLSMKTTSSQDKIFL